ncbi:MAG: DUF5103 domain-containing protein [Bacteroidales bacterium]|nr:DUF5103 domain-containing protein [Bacteroidales bacterium]
MSRLLKLFLAALCLSAVAPISAAEPLKTEIFNDAFRTLKVQKDEDFFALPVIRLGSDDVLTFSFDEMGDDYSLLEYRLVHCNADWKPSSLLDSEIVARFNSAKVEDYAFSSNTYIHFVNYRISIPNDDISPLVSGNYILQVFPENNPDEVLLQARFAVSEESIGVSGRASSHTDRGSAGPFQQLSFTLAAPKLDIRDPFSELIVVAAQNEAPESIRYIRAPLRASNHEIVYEHLPDLIFPAGNEFRRFESVRVDYPGMHIDSITFAEPAYHVWLAPDFPRADSEYLYDSTQHGRFLVREHNATDSDLAADYLVTHFSLKAPYVKDRDIFVQGEFSAFSLDKAYKMYYDFEDRAYHLNLPLKQGSYNYRYFSPQAPSAIEGDKHETSNEYSVRVYYRTPGARADRLIATAQFISQ